MRFAHVFLPVFLKVFLNILFQLKTYSGYLFLNIVAADFLDAMYELTAAMPCKDIVNSSMMTGCKHGSA